MIRINLYAMKIKNTILPHSLVLDKDNYKKPKEVLKFYKSSISFSSFFVLVLEGPECFWGPLALNVTLKTQFSKIKVTLFTSDEDIWEKISFYSNMSTYAYQSQLAFLISCSSTFFKLFSTQFSTFNIQ